MDEDEEESRKDNENVHAARRLFLTALWKHVAIWKSFMSAHAHDVWLLVRREISNIAWKQDAKFLALSPMRTVFMEKFNQAVFIAKGKGVSSLILPTEIHRGRGQVAIPRVPDVLADVVQQVVRQVDVYQPKRCR